MTQILRRASNFLLGSRPGDERVNSILMAFTPLCIAPLGGLDARVTRQPGPLIHAGAPL